MLALPSNREARGRTTRRIWLSAIIPVLAFGACRQFPTVEPKTDMEKQGRDIFRDDTFGDDAYWTDTAKLNDVVQHRIRPLTALGLGLKVDMNRLNLVKFLLHNPFGTSGTRELLRENAVVGVRAKVEHGKIVQIGITCAFCHSTVDNALLPGIGHRLDGWPNRDLKVGKILAMLANYTEDQKVVLRGWPTGTYDPRFNFDGQSTPLTLPPAHGLAEVKNETYTAEGPMSYWNAYVAVTQMHGHGNFSDPRIPVNIVQEPDMVTPKLAALRAYQHSIGVPPTPGASYDRGRASRGELVFQKNCVTCHVAERLTDNNNGAPVDPNGMPPEAIRETPANNGVLHAPSETGMDPRYAARTTQKAYRTTPLRALWQHAPYFHDGSAKTLEDVVEHYNRVRNLGLTSGQKRDLVEFLKSL